MEEQIGCTSCHRFIGQRHAGIRSVYKECRVMLCFSWWKSDRSCKKPVTMRARCEASLNRSGRVLQLAVHLRSELKLGKTRLTSGHGTNALLRSSEQKRFEAPRRPPLAASRLVCSLHSTLILRARETKQGALKRKPKPAWTASSKPIPKRMRMSIKCHLRNEGTALQCC